jgi:crotonobetainyl-CoA:carnitine CoA-transferase CaiB-like acyl-CoA transferase
LIEEPFVVEAAPVRSDRLPDPPDRAAPLLGEHTAEVLREWLQMRDAEIAELVAEKVLEQFSFATEYDSPPAGSVLMVRE